MAYEPRKTDPADPNYATPRTTPVGGTGAPTTATGATPAGTATTTSAGVPPRPAEPPRNTQATGAYANPMDAGARRTPDQIERDIEATRARMEARLEALSHDVAPATLLQNSLGANLNSPTETMNALYERARHNPLAAVLIGGGLAALYFGSRATDPVAERRAREAEVDREVPGPATRDAAERVAYDIQALKGHARAVGEDVSAARARLGSQASAASTSASDTAASLSRSAEEARDYAAGTAASAAAAARDTYERTTSRVSSAYERASERVSEAYDEAADALSHAPTYARERVDYATSWVQENPIAAGLIGLAAGATVASVVAAAQSNKPRSRREATRQLYRRSDGYQTAEELQRYATRRRSPYASSYASTRTGTGAAGTGTRNPAAPTTPNMADSTANQGARRAPATAKETDNTVSTSARSTVGETSATPRTGSTASTAGATSTGSTTSKASTSKPTTKSSSSKSTSAKSSPPKKAGAKSKTGKTAASGSGTTGGRTTGTGSDS